MIKAGRCRPAKMIGEKNGESKLTAADVLEIRAITGKTLREIAALYGVSKMTISNVIRRKTWTHLPEENEDEREVIP
jgi:transposase